MKLNNENKAKFFALYWGQEVYSHRTWNGLSSDTGVIVNEGSFLHLDGARLLLKPLSQITDEDAEYINYTNVDELNPWDVDYLRSKGYALSFMGRSVEQMVEAGWIKLIDVS